ncbi:hypothetical protein DPMN_158908 [Dreissena polymorpha]|uniref:Uncharacterized protein n=1 Tax=Dreissena polymorpha TaxID=45954 RepID=A0A9D4IRA5_DREPO|nr:hypothetical protein DPMN_158908 [Dreissena polymorpha]
MSNEGEWIKLDNMSCPVKECPGLKIPVNWVCAKDGQSVFVNEYGRIKCAASISCSGIHIANVCEWGWKCSNDKFHKGQYIIADWEGSNFALSEALRFANKTSSKWISQLVLSLGEQFDE